VVTCIAESRGTRDRVASRISLSRALECCIGIRVCFALGVLYGGRRWLVMKLCPDGLLGRRTTTRALCRAMNLRLKVRDLHCARPA
jgi:hypothetical protein